MGFGARLILVFGLLARVSIRLIHAILDEANVIIKVVKELLFVLTSHLIIKVPKEVVVG